MPRLPDHPGVLRVTVHIELGADLNAQVRQFFTYTGTAPSNTDCISLATQISGEVDAHLIPFMSADRINLGVDVIDLTSVTSGQGLFTEHTPGTEAGTPLPADVCLLQNFTIGRRYRGGKPRSYWPMGTVADLLSPQQWVGASLTAFHTALQNYVNAVTSTSAAGTSISAQCSISNYLGFTAIPNPVTGRTRDAPKVRAVAIPPDVIAGFTLNSHLASQRRRNLIRL